MGCIFVCFCFLVCFAFVCLTHGKTFEYTIYVARCTTAKREHVRVSMALLGAVSQTLSD